MRILIICFTISFLSITAAAQKNFGGIIDFNMKGADSAPILHIKAWFKYPKIKMQTMVMKTVPGVDAKNEVLILDFRKGTISRIKAEDKKVEVESMKGSGKKEDIPFLKADSSLVRQIAGHWCIGYTTGEITKIEQKDSATVTTKANITIWYAADLYFKVPAPYKAIQMAPLLTNGQVALGSRIGINAAGHNLSLVTTTEKMDARSLQKKVFNLPQGYKIQNNK